MEKEGGRKDKKFRSLEVRRKYIALKKTSYFFDNFKEKRSLCGGLRVKEPRKASKIRAKRKSSKDGSRTNNK